MPCPRSAAVVLARMQVTQPAARGMNRFANRAFLDIHVERIQQETAGRMIDAVDDLDRLLRQVDEAGLEPVQRLNAQDDPTVGGELCEPAELSHEQFYVLCPLLMLGL